MLVVVGAGPWGRNHIQTAAALGRLRSVVDVNGDRLDEARGIVGDESDVLFTTELEQACLMPGVTGCIVAVPPAAHFSVAKKCLQLGMDVMVEKPMALNPADARELISLADAGRRILMVGHLLIYDSAFQKMLALISAGSIGTLKHIAATRKNFGTVRAKENVLWSLAPHDISMAVAVGNAASKVSDSPCKATVEFCFGSALVSEDIHDSVSIRLRLQQNVPVDIQVSWLHPTKERKLVVTGEKGFLVFDDATPNPDDKLTLFNKWFEKGIPPRKVVPQDSTKSIQIPSADQSLLTLEQLHFLDCSHSRDTPVTCGEEGFVVTSILHDAQRLLDEDRPKPNSSFSKPYFAHPSAVIDDGAIIGGGTKVWHFSHLCSGSLVGNKCNIGQNVYIAPTARLGSNVKIQNNVSVYDGVVCEDDVFLGPSCVFTNIKNPRSAIVRRGEFMETILERGTTVGANATIVCGLRLGRNCFVGAGAVVTRDVAPYTMVCGSPARFHAYVSPEGHALVQDQRGKLKCNVSQKHYVLDNRGYVISE